MNLVNGFSESDTQKIELFLKRFIKYVNPTDFVIVGGIPVNYYLFKAGKLTDPRPLHDINMIIKSHDVIKKEITSDFLIYHHHFDPINPSNFYFAIADEESKTYVNIFDYNNWPPQEILEINFFGHRLQIVSLEDQLVRHVHELSWTLKHVPRNKRMYDHAKAMLEICDLKKAEKYWESKRDNDLTMMETIDKIDKELNKNAELLVEKVHKKKSPYECEGCIHQPEFPIAPMEKVFKILGIEVS